MKYRIILGVLYFRNQFVWPNFSAPFEKKSPRLQLLLVDVMYQFLFFFFFFFSGFLLSLFSILSLCITLRRFAIFTKDELKRQLWDVTWLPSGCISLLGILNNK